MKKFLALLLAVVMVLSVTSIFTGCAKKEEEKGKVYYLNFKPEFDTALQGLAKKYTEKTGIEVKVVTAASGSYSDTLNANIGDVTIFNIGNAAGLEDWDDYALDLTDSAIAKELTTNDFNLYNADGELKAIGNCYESFGIIVNTNVRLSMM